MNFKNHDIVYFVGPPKDMMVPMMSDVSEHKLYKKRGRIAIGISEDIRCYPDEPNDTMYWVRFEDDSIDLRQVDGNWLLSEEAFYRDFL
jgi:hypothetical protein